MISLSPLRRISTTPHHWPTHLASISTLTTPVLRRSLHRCCSSAAAWLDWRELPDASFGHKIVALFPKPLFGRLLYCLMGFAAATRSRSGSHLQSTCRPSSNSLATSQLFCSPKTGKSRSDDATCAILAG